MTDVDAAAEPAPDPTPQEESAGKALNDLFRTHLKVIISNHLGKDISVGTAWKIFRDMLRGTAQFCMKENLVGDDKLALSGAGTFGIRKSTARGMVRNGEMLQSPKTQWPFVPKFKYAASTRIDSDLETLFGFDGRELSEVELLGLYGPQKCDGDACPDEAAVAPESTVPSVPDDVASLPPEFDSEPDESVPEVPPAPAEI